MFVCLQIIAKKIAGPENITVRMNPPGIQIVVDHQVAGNVYKISISRKNKIICCFKKIYFSFTAMTIRHIIDQDEKRITEISNLQSITVQARNLMPIIIQPIIIIIPVIIMAMGVTKGDMIGNCHSSEIRRLCLMK